MLKRVILSEAPFFTKYSLPYNYQIVNRVFGNFDTPVSDGKLQFGGQWPLTIRAWLAGDK